MHSRSFNKLQVTTSLSIWLVWLPHSPQHFWVPRCVAGTTRGWRGWCRRSDGCGKENRAAGEGCARATSRSGIDGIGFIRVRRWGYTKWIKMAMLMGKILDIYQKHPDTSRNWQTMTDQHDITSPHHRPWLWCSWVDGKKHCRTNWHRMN